MRDRPSSIHTCCRVLLAALVGVACASTGGKRDETVAESGSSRETPRSLLEATTPRAAATQRDASGQTGPDSQDEGRPGRLLIYSAITGHVPLRDKAHDPADRYRSPQEREAVRARSIEAEIEEELARQEKLTVEEKASTKGALPAPPKAADPAAQALDAAPAPELRDLPEKLFDSEEVAIAPGTWQNQETLYLVKRSLDVDDDGAPEEVRYVDPSSGVLVRSEQDLDYDGELDTWTTYENGKAVVRLLDTDGDGRTDAWERYAQGRLNARALDRDGDGTRDTFYHYEGELLARKTYDGNNDGTTDKIESFEDRHRVRSEEDRSLNGQMDTWTSYGVVDGREVVTRVERDSRDSGRPDLIEIYETRDGVTRLVRREEDLNGDGGIDVISTYEDGKLVQRAISDEALSPL